MKLWLCAHGFNNSKIIFLALGILRQQGRKELFYQFAPSLMQAVPRQTVHALIEQGRGLAPSRLIPALVMSDQGENDTQVRTSEC